MQSVFAGGTQQISADDIKDSNTYLKFQSKSGRETQITEHKGRVSAKRGHQD